MADRMTITAQRLRARMEEIGCSQEDLAAGIGVTQGAISLILTGKTQKSRLLPQIARNIGVNLAWLTGDSDELINMDDENGDPITEDELAKILTGRSPKKLFSRPRFLPIGKDEIAADEPHSNAVQVPSSKRLAEQLDLVEVQEIDLKFGMGATELEIPVTKMVRHFSRDWLRQYTRADPDKVYFAQGIGDSMAPTINDSDLLIIDSSEQMIRMADKIWAVAFCGQGMVKRLRQTRDGVLILSDNKEVAPPETAHDGELHILGRVVGIVRKM